MKCWQPKLYYNSGKQDKLALELLAKAGISYIAMGPTTVEPTPFLEYGYWKYEGIGGISKFISVWKEDRLPSLL